MVSGIGPRATLEEYGIPVLADLPGVGSGMWVSASFYFGDRRFTPSGPTILWNHIKSQRPHTIRAGRSSSGGSSGAAIHVQSRRPFEQPGFKLRW